MMKYVFFFWAMLGITALQAQSKDSLLIKEQGFTILLQKLPADAALAESNGPKMFELRHSLRRVVLALCAEEVRPVWQKEAPEQVLKVKITVKEAAQMPAAKQRALQELLKWLRLPSQYSQQNQEVWLLRIPKAERLPKAQPNRKDGILERSEDAVWVHYHTDLAYTAQQIRKEMGVWALVKEPSTQKFKLSLQWSTLEVLQKQLENQGITFTKSRESIKVLLIG